MLERIRKTRTPVSEVALAPLGMEDVLALVADTVRSDRERARPLAAVVCAKTAGNPFFVLQFLSLLHQERLLWLDEAASPGAGTSRASKRADTPTTSSISCCSG